MQARTCSAKGGVRLPVSTQLCVIEVLRERGQVNGAGAPIVRTTQVAGCRCGPGVTRETKPPKVRHSFLFFRLKPTVDEAFAIHNGDGIPLKAYGSRKQLRMERHMTTGFL